MALKRSYTLVKERFENVDLSGSQEYASSVYRRASKTTEDAAKAARQTVTNAYNNAAPAVQNAGQNVSTSAQSLWSNAFKFARGFYTPGDPAVTAVFAQITGAPFARTGHSLAVVKGRAYIFGGERTPGTPVNNDMSIVLLPVYGGQGVDYLTLPARPREKGGPVPAARKNHTAVVIGDAMFIFGGEVTGDATAEKEGRIWLYDTSTNSWSAIDPSPESPYPAPRHGHSAAASESPEAPDTRPKPKEDILPQQPPEAGTYLPEPAAQGTWGTIFLYGGAAAKSGGEGSKAELLNEAWGFDLRTRTWYALPPPPGPARTGASLEFAGDALWRFGGFDGESYIGGTIDKLDVGGMWSFGARSSALSELVRSSGKDEWLTKEFSDVAGKVPCARANAALLSVTTGPRKGQLVLIGGEGRPAGAAAGKGKAPAPAGSETAAEPEGSSVRVLDDIWAFQWTTQGSSTIFEDPVQESLDQTMGSPWREASYQFVDEVGDVKDDNTVGDLMTKGRAVRRRAGFAASKGTEIDGATVVIWGGVDGRGAVRSDGYKVTIES